MSKHCLENLLCFKLYALSRQATATYRPLLEALDLTYPQYLVLLVLWEEKAATVKELCTRLYLDSGTLTPLLKRLAHKGIVERRRDPSDERSVIVTLTDAGAALQQQARKIPGALDRQLPLGKKEYQRLSDQLDRLLDALAGRD